MTSPNTIATLAVRGVHLKCLYLFGSFLERHIVRPPRCRVNEETSYCSTSPGPGLGSKQLQEKLAPYNSKYPTSHHSPISFLPAMLPTEMPLAWMMMMRSVIYAAVEAQFMNDKAHPAVLEQ